MITYTIEDFIKKKEDKKKKMNMALIQYLPNDDRLSMFRKSLIMSLIKSNYDRKNS